MTESWNTRLRRYAFNFFPAYRGTGARFTYIAGDWREVRIKLPCVRREDDLHPAQGRPVDRIHRLNPKKLLRA
jgi:hypothetical protein